MTQPSAPLQWDVFCRVIDNFGDIGVCWRLVAQLAALGHRVRLWVDDASALEWMAPTGCPGVELRAWGSPPPGPGEPPPDVMLEAFGCDIAPEFIAYSAYQSGARGQKYPKPVWINLEYLSAESYVERHHKLSSLLSSGPAASWTRWFFYPGFTPGTGGLLREPGLMARREAFDRSAWRAEHASAFGLGNGGPEQRWVSLFCYEPAALPELLRHSQAQPTQLLVTPGRPTAAVRAALAKDGVKNSSPMGHQPLCDKREQLSISYLPHRPQPAFDEMLWACDFNAVRGEDSLVRALWAGQAFVWHIYPQHDNAHHDKLWAFLDWLQAPPSLRQFHATWNGLDSAPLPWPDDNTLAEWTACAQAARARLLTQDNLVTQLLGFVTEKR
ncbi:elongation factor P maturation arginine rhamnosyltransferase EarP [Acidovorax sp. D2M1]|uniref:Protein-arginine rhamnosyltransferase n=1 Tax=Acidovorax benzenivorans TaxID=2987520 RepID=A0ABT5RVU5_9BURK|nr:elongation factor P maturation arginine rhamnosyltransferase EarP [Acidovorax benzenivorans]MDD2177811.1 elongation factor P maturation arginine rhamnosyltransferase EarP [Acidovorax benzenivorans]